MMSPKAMTPVLATIVCNLARLDIYLTALTKENMGDANIDFEDPAAKSSGYPKIHTPSGVDPVYEGQGYGTALYASGAWAMGLLFDEKIPGQIPHKAAEMLSGMYPGISSIVGRRTPEADAWWRKAVRSGLAEQSDKEVYFDAPDQWITIQTSSSDAGPSDVRRSSVNTFSMAEIAKEILGVLHRDVEEVAIRNAKIQLFFEGSYTRLMAINTIDAMRVEEMNLVLAQPIEYKAYLPLEIQAAGWTALDPTNWKLTSLDALKSISMKTLVPSWRTSALQSERAVEWWLRFLENQNLPYGERQRWDDELNASASGSAFRERARSRSGIVVPASWKMLP